MSSSLSLSERLGENRAGIGTDSARSPMTPMPVSIGRRLRRWCVHRILRNLMLLYALSLGVARIVGRRPRSRGRTEGQRILLTGTFYSENWVTAHLRPLAASKNCARVWMVATYPIPSIAKVEVIRPAPWLCRLAGAVPARLMTFAWLSLRRRPDIVGGFHLLVNGLLAALMARLVGARSLYICTGGPSEIIDGGIWAENRIFGKLVTPDPVIERRLIRAVRVFDLVITRGARAVEFFRQHGVRTALHVVTGGIDAKRFAPDDTSRSTDLVIVGRLAAIKRIDVFLRTLALVAEKMPDVSATIVGDGELRQDLERLVGELGLEQRVVFAGHQTDVDSWLKGAKVFVLTSDSEGLALSLIEAMMCGLPAVVSDVGELGDLVENGVNGYLVPRRSPEAFADRICELLQNGDKLAAFSGAARQAALQHETGRVAHRWDEILKQEVS